jgi:hypothetical protein
MNFNVISIYMTGTRALFQRIGGFVNVCQGNLELQRPIKTTRIFILIKHFSLSVLIKAYQQTKSNLVNLSLRGTVSPV